MIGCSCGYIRSRPPYEEADQVYLLRKNSNNRLMVEVFKKMAGRKGIDNFD